MATFSKTTHILCSQGYTGVYIYAFYCLILQTRYMYIVNRSSAGSSVILLCIIAILLLIASKEEIE